MYVIASSQQDAMRINDENEWVKGKSVLLSAKRRRDERMHSMEEALAKEHHLLNASSVDRTELKRAVLQEEAKDAAAEAKDGSDRFASANDWLRHNIDGGVTSPVSSRVGKPRSINGVTFSTSGVTVELVPTRSNGGNGVNGGGVDGSGSDRLILSSTRQEC